MIRPAVQADLPQIHACAQASFAHTMFLRSNLLEHGLNGQGDHAMRVWLDADKGAEGGIFALTRNGFLLAHAPKADAENWNAFAQVLAGSQVCGMTGAPEQVAAALDAIGGTDRRFLTNRSEPLYSLELDQLTELSGDLRRPGASNMALLARWQCAGNAESLGSGEDAEAIEAARAQTERACSRDLLRVLWDGGVPVAKTTFNAVLPDTVQVGGVFTPPQLRGRGHARRAVSCHLREARSHGVARAVLFAANVAAARAYEAIGFRRVGSYHIALFEHALEVGA